MKATIALDPGIRGVGIALFLGETLAACDYVKNTATTGNGLAEVLLMAEAARQWSDEHLPTGLLRWVDAHSVTPLGLAEQVQLSVVVEWPQVYTAGKSKGDNNDLLPLVGIGSAFAAKLQPAAVSSVRPSEWKGQLDKDATHARVLKRLDTYERRVWQNGCERAKSKAHNLTDAVAIGLHALGRFSPVRVISRGREGHA